MANRIKHYRILVGPATPAEAWIGISVYPERLTSVTQVRGRLVGPRCPFATTVEVAYPTREQSREYETTGTPKIMLRVIIPEPNLWEPETPFLYQGPLELFQGKEHCDTVQIACSLRTLQLGPRGLRLTGRPLVLNGVSTSEYSEAKLRTLHQAGYNTLVVPPGPDITRWCELADRFGFFILGRIKNKADVKSRDLRSSSPSILGWLVDADLFQDELSRIALPSIFSPMGIELTRVPEEVPSGTEFLACEGSLLPFLEGIHLPKLVIRKKPARTDSPATASADGSDILGWIEEEKPAH